MDFCNFLANDFSFSLMNLCLCLSSTLGWPIGFSTAVYIRKYFGLVFSMHSMYALSTLDLHCGLLTFSYLPFYLILLAALLDRNMAILGK